MAAPPNILSVPPPLRYITFGTSWSSANALQISHFHTAYVQSRSANKHCNTACVQSRSANKHCNTAYMQSRSANKHCNTAYMQSRSANSHGHTEYVSHLMVHYVLSVRGPNDFKFVFLAFLKPFITLYVTFLCRQCVPGVGTFIHNATFELSSSWYMHREYFSIV